MLIMNVQGRGLITVGLNRTTLLLLLLTNCRSFLSQDFAFTVAPEAMWRSVVSSGDGTKLAAFAQKVYLQSSILPDLVYVSSDSGATWSPAKSLPSYYHSLALTPDATTLVVVSGEFAFTSHDLGITWKTNALPGPYVQQIAL